MIRLYGNFFSPFSRKISLAIEYKQLDYEMIDGLARENHHLLVAANPRGEVPTIDDEGVIVTQSSDIAIYLDEAYPTRPIFPADPKDRVIARRLQYLFDTAIDAALVNSSLWTWARRDDERPDGLLEAAQSEVERALAEVEAALEPRLERCMFGSEPGIVEFTAWPHLAALRPLGLVIDRDRYPKTGVWCDHLRSDPLFQTDAARTAAGLQSMSDLSHERTKIAWRGDRIEWILAKGYHEWFYNEIQQDRVIWPS